MVNRFFKLFCLFSFLFIYTGKAYAAGVDAILLIPVGWLIALVLTIVSILIAPNKQRVTKIHVGSILFYIFIAYGQGGHDWTFVFSILYPIASSIIILIFSLILRQKFNNE